MEESITQIIEKNAVVRDWSLKTQREKGDSLVEGRVVNLPEHTTVNVRQTTLRIWCEFGTNGIQTLGAGIFHERTVDSSHGSILGPIISALHSSRGHDSNHRRVGCFTPHRQCAFSKIYVKEPKPLTFRKKLVRLTDMTDAWAEKQIKKKNETVCIPWSSLRESVLSHPDILKRVNLFALAIYGLVIFPRVLEHIEVAVFDFFERLFFERLKQESPCPDYLS
ncbi:hypothetical protein CXB51_003903 [Gossypium anomalum]|uniref:Uncharacterized protein n=1 Tax=Gossypium anomalum TaxID=47600 RepID=A0A8J5ZM36_9ROSI|nr:hypothetical protein CXB51_003903 [Gossypium anomalum]